MRRKQKEDGTKEIVLPGTKRASSLPVGADWSEEPIHPPIVFHINGIEKREFNDELKGEQLPDGESINQLIDNQQESFNKVFDDANENIEKTKQSLSKFIDESEKPKNSFERIVTYQFQAIDDEEEYKYLESKLSFKNKSKYVRNMSYGELAEALDEAEQDAFRASTLCARAHLLKEEFERDTKVIEGALRLEANKSLMDIKIKNKNESGLAGKKISNEDVEAEMARRSPDEWALIRTRKIQAEQSLEIYESLALRLAERAKDLRQMVYSTRATD